MSLPSADLTAAAAAADIEICTVEPADEMITPMMDEQAAETTVEGEEGQLTVGYAKTLLTAAYPKLCTRYHTAFGAFSDDMPLEDAVDAIAGDVSGWLTSMPDSNKTSSHALSRPRYGILFVLENASVRSVLGEMKCIAAADKIKRAWEECKRQLIAPSDKSAAAKKKNKPSAAPAAKGPSSGTLMIDGATSDGEGDDADSDAEDSGEELYRLRARVAAMTTKIDVLTASLLSILNRHYDGSVAALVGDLISLSSSEV